MKYESFKNKLNKLGDFKINESVVGMNTIDEVYLINDETKIHISYGKMYGEIVSYKIYRAGFSTESFGYNGMNFLRALKAYLVAW